MTCFISILSPPFPSQPRENQSSLAGVFRCLQGRRWFFRVLPVPGGAEGVLPVGYQCQGLREMALGNTVLSWLLLPAAQRYFLGKVQPGLQSPSWHHLNSAPFEMCCTEQGHYRTFGDGIASPKPWGMQLFSLPLSQQRLVNRSLLSLSFPSWWMLCCSKFGVSGSVRKINFLIKNIFFGGALMSGSGVIISSSRETVL